MKRHYYDNYLTPKGLNKGVFATVGMIKTPPQGLIASLITPRYDWCTDQKTGMYAIAKEDLESEVFRQESIYHVSGILLGGPAGEGAYLAPREVTFLVRVVGMTKKDRELPLMASIWGYNPIPEARAAKDAGASHIVVHLRETTINAFDDIVNVAKRKKVLQFGEADLDTPLLLYFDPKVTGEEVSLDTVAQLSNNPLVVGVIDGTGSASNIPYLVQHVGDGVAVYTTDEKTCLAAISVGARGVVSSVANIFPNEMSKMVNAALHGDWKTAQEYKLYLQNFFDVCSGETDPTIIKTVLTTIGRTVGPAYTLPGQGDQSKTNKVIHTIAAFYPGLFK